MRRIAIAAALAASLAVPASAAAGIAQSDCPGGAIETASGCQSFGEARGDVEEIVRQEVEANGLRAALVRVNVGDRRLATVAQGDSMPGVPASPRMHFRLGSMGIPYLINLLLQLQDDGVLSLDDPVSDWMPQLANADRVTLRMLASSTSGYPDWIQGNDVFVDAFYADVFRLWQPSELLAYAFDRPLACEPAACFTYSHANFAILEKILHKETGDSVARLIRKRVFRPLGLRDIGISPLATMPEPALHAYTSERGPYEDTTSWSPSWTLGKDSIMTGTIGDIARTARAIGSGRLISREASRDQFAPITADYPGFSEQLYYGLGINVANTWRFQNPDLNGYTGIMAYLPAQDLSIGLTTTNSETSTDDGVNYSQRLWAEIANYLAPDHPITLPG